MVAYSFAPRFCLAVEALAKRQTVRGHRRRHARPGEPVQLYAGMRTRHCRKLVERDPICASVDAIEIVVEPSHPSTIASIAIAGAALTDAEIEAFANTDGFPAEDLPFAGKSARQAMGEFWLSAHGAGLFRGVLIKWRPLPVIA